MRKIELAQAVHSALDGHAVLAEPAELVDAVFAEMKRALARGDDLKNNGFGVFQVRDKTTREGRNLRTGKSLTISARRVVRFKASNVVKGEMNRGK